VNRAKLEELGFIKKESIPVKLLAEGELTKKLTIEVELASKSAIEKVQAAGGTVTIG
jgi:large subunit ribosomal protein L15